MNNKNSAFEWLRNDCYQFAISKLLNNSNEIDEDYYKSLQQSTPTQDLYKFNFNYPSYGKSSKKCKQPDLVQLPVKKQKTVLKKNEKKFPNCGCNSVHDKNRQFLLNTVFSNTVEPLEKHEMEENENMMNSGNLDTNLRYQNYIQKGIDTDNIAEIGEQQIIAIKELVNPKLLNDNQELTENLFKNIKEDYILNLKKIVVVLNLVDQTVTNTDIDYLIKRFDDPILDLYPKPWHNTFLNNKKFLKNNLYTLNPIALHINRLWLSYQKEMTIINSQNEMLSSEHLPIELPVFLNICSRNLDHVLDVSIKKWQNDLFQILENARIKRILPYEEQKLKCLYNSLNRLLRNHIHVLIKNSLEDYINIFFFEKNFRCFLLNVVFKDSEILLDPPSSAFNDNALTFIDIITESLCMLPLIEDLLCTESQNAKKLRRRSYNLLGKYEQLAENNIKFNIYFDSNIINNFKKDLSHKILHDYNNCQSKLEIFTEINQTFKNKIEIAKTFLNETSASFDEYVDLILMLKELLQKVNEDTPKYLYTDGIFILCSEIFVRSLSKQIDAINAKIINKLYEHHKQENEKLFEEFDKFSKTALTTPVNISQLIELSNIVETQIKEITSQNSQTSLENSNLRMQYLLELNVFSANDFETNARLFHWAHKIPLIYEEHKSIIAEKKDLFMKNLEERRLRLKEEYDALNKPIEELKKFGDINYIHVYYKKAQQINKKLLLFAEKVDELQKDEEILGLKSTTFPQRQTLTTQFQPYFDLFQIGSEFTTKSEEWLKGSVKKINSEQLDTTITNYWRHIYKLEKGFLNNPKAKKMATKIRNDIDEFKQYMPAITTLLNPGLRDRHWEEINEYVGFDFKPDETTTLESLVQTDLTHFMAKLESISESATKELNIEKTIQKIKSDWKEIKFTIIPFRDTGTFVFSSVEEVQNVIDDHLLKLLTAKSSSFIKPFEEEAIELEKSLRNIQELFDRLLHIQADWMYLQSIFSSVDIVSQMHEEGRKFRQINTIWRDILSKLYENPLCMSLLEIEKVSEKLKKALNLLNEVLKGLNNYLEKKRLYFPRFFFLSNDDLLEILSETKDPNRVKPHLHKCFEGIFSVEFNSSLELTHIISDKNEIVELQEKINTVKAHGLVEKWLLELENMMKTTVKTITLKSIDCYVDGPDRIKWIRSWMSQAVLCVTQFYWAKNIEKALNSNHAEKELNDYLVKYNNQIGDIVNQIRNNKSDDSISASERITLTALIVLEVHARDVLTNLIDKKVSKIDDFNWLSQLRYYIENDDIYCKMINARRIYGYEYLGNTSRLVMTPLTDRCFRTLLMALNLNLGGAPEGPAGTGKTETTKDLAKALAKQCVVFNCSEGLDYLALGKFFKGLASSGAWSCFDEFNRIDLEVLSVIAQQILTIQRGINAKLEMITFEGTELILNSTCAIFITMNPGYAGRSELPDNLKALFRPVAMMVPDYALISEISLYSYGFHTARTLAIKIVTMYKLCSEQLSTQSHYDYGMRAVKSVLIASEALKLKFPNENESVLVLRSLIDVNLPKFLTFDVPLFKGIINELFPEIQMPENNYADFNSTVKECCDKLNLECTPYFLEKVQQIYEMIQVRHGLMLVGTTLSGKTSAYKVLANALTQLHEKNLLNENKVQICLINPKSMSTSQLYGSYDLASHEWIDGILAINYRKFLNENTDDRKWLIFDGPVDAIWIENMNSVLDDNKKLCLMSGEIISLPEKTNLIFETLDLEQASPATVSRCGMIYVQSKSLGWQPLIKSWLRNLPKVFNDQQKAYLNELFCRFVDPCIKFIKTNKLKTFTKMISDSYLVNCLIKLCNCLIDVLVNPTEFQYIVFKEITLHLESIFFFSLIWSIGSNLNQDSRKKFNLFLKNIIENNGVLKENEKISLGLANIPDFQEQKFQAYFPENLCCFDYKLKIGAKVLNQVIQEEILADSDSSEQQFENENEQEQTEADCDLHKNDNKFWEPWSVMLHDLSKSYVIPKDITFNEIIVPTIDKISHSYLMSLFLSENLKYNSSLLFVGPTGTGKSCYTNNYLLKLANKKSLNPIIINFSAQTTVNQVQDLIMEKLEKHRKGLYGPPIGRKCVIFIDDVNMPQMEKYGAQPPIELLRQLIDHTFWYDHKDKSRVYVNNFIVICSMPSSESGLNSLTERFMRHFNIFGIDEADDSTSKRIFSTILNWHFTTRGFNEIMDVEHIVYSIIKCTIGIYKESVKKFLPVPKTCHYLFNLRDISRVMQGLCLSYKETHGSILSIKRMWLHEIIRVFSDRLLLEHHKLLIEIVSKEYSACFDEDLKSLVPFSNNGSIDLIFADFINDHRHYSEVTDIEQLQNAVESSLDEYNLMHKTTMNLVIFKAALQHICRICRILKLPYNHGLLIGAEGSGRQSLTRLAAAMVDYDLYEIQVTRKYGIVEWHEDLRKLLKKLITSEQPHVFLITENQIKEEAFLEDISNLLNSGEVPNLFSVEDKQEICDRMRILDRRREKAHQTDGSAVALFNYFIKYCKSILHIVLIMSPYGNSFRTRIRKFPSLVNCCTIDWFHPWSEEALEAVGLHFLLTIEEMDMDQIKRCINVFKYFQNTSEDLAKRMLYELNRYYYITSASYLQLINCFKNLYIKKKNEIKNTKEQYMNSLNKLETTALEINVMQKELVALQPELIKSSKELEESVAYIEKESVEVAKIETIVKKEEEIAGNQARIAEAIKRECDIELAQVMPQYNMAIAALNTITSNDISILKAMKNPPIGVRLVMEAICVLMDIKPEKVVDQSNLKKYEDYWTPSKKLLANNNFLDTIRNFDKDNISPSAIKRIREKYIPNPDFMPEKIKIASSAAEGLCKWVRAMDPYDRVAKIVFPKRERLKNAEEKLKQAVHSLNVKQQQLKQIKEKLDEVNYKMANNKIAKENLENQVNQCKKKIERAEILISGLGGEKVRWTQELENQSLKFENLVGDMLISSGIITYMGPFIISYRQEQLKKWIGCVIQQNILLSKDYSLVSSLGNPLEIREWNIAGLPNDSCSIDNAIIIRNSNNWPLIIDPQEQANKWIKNFEKTSNLNITKFENSNYHKIVETCITFGYPCLIENVGEELDPLLEPVLLKQTFRQGSNLYLKFDDRIIEYSPDFRLYMTTKLENPEYLPKIIVKVNLMNFKITNEGLEDQLLGIVVATERPELEEEKNSLIIQSAANKKQMKDIESKMLQILSNTKGNILEDEEAINVLSSSKTLENEIAEKQAIAEETEKKIDTLRYAYRPISVHTAILFFSCISLSKINPMYQYSLQWFIQLFIKSLELAQRSDETEKRMYYIKEHFTYSLFCTICRSLFEKDKVLFSFLLCMNALKHDNKVEENELKFLITEGVPLENAYSNPTVWLSTKSWNDICRLDALPAFSSIRRRFLEEKEKWKIVYDSEEPHNEAFPLIWQEKLNDFQRLLLIRCIRPDKVVDSIICLSKKYLGKKFIEYPTFDLNSSYDDSTCINPLLLLLSPGIDPMRALLSFSNERLSSTGHLKSLSLGQGQGVIAEKMILTAQNEGDWLVLQNCHLMPSWLGILERICEDFKIENTHSNFRLWLTTYPTDEFPISVLQNSIKITSEPAKGLKYNLTASYTMSPLTDYFKEAKQEHAWKKLLFGLIFFHAVVQERRSYIPLGWNIPYEFNETDLRISIEQLNIFMNDYETIQFDAIRYLTAECNYGGRVTDYWDRRTLNSLLSKFYTQEIINDDNYKFDESGLYYAPKDGPIEVYLEYIKSLPISSNPSILYLHQNADITKDTNEANMILNSLSLIQGRSKVQFCDGNMDSQLNQVISDILHKIPDSFDIKASAIRYPITYLECMNTVLIQEMIRYNKLIDLIRISLYDTQKAISGQMMMSDEIEEIIDSINKGKLPNMWKKISYPSMKSLGAYINDLILRLEFFKNWYENGAPKVFWLSAFYFTQSFLTGIQENYARKYVIPIDQLTFNYEIMDDNNTTLSIQDGAYIKGIYLNGARWDRRTRRLAEMLPKILYDQMPIIWICPNRKDNIISVTNVYNAPLYITSERRGTLSTTGHSTNYVTDLKIPINGSGDDWIRRGCACILQLND